MLKTSKLDDQNDRNNGRHNDDDFTAMFRDKIREAALKAYKSELTCPANIDLGLHGVTRAKLRVLCKNAVLESSSQMRRRYSHSQMSSIISVQDESDKVSALRSLQKERLIVSRLGFVDKAMELDREIEKMREKVKVAREKEENVLLKQRMKLLNVSHMRKQARLEYILNEESKELENKLNAEEAKMFKRQEIEFMRVLEGATRRAVGRVKKCNCHEPYLCRHNKTASYNTRRPTKTVVTYRRNARRLRHAGRPDEALIWDEKAKELDEKEQEHWRLHIAEGIISSPWGANEGIVDQLTESHKKELNVLHKTHAFKRETLRKQHELRRKNFKNALLGEERKMRWSVHKQCLLRTMTNFEEEWKEAEREKRLSFRSDGLNNVSKNLLGLEFDDDERKQVDWVPPTAFGLDNSVRLVDALSEVQQDTNNAITRDNIGEAVRIYTKVGDMKNKTAKEIRDKINRDALGYDPDNVNEEDDGTGDQESTSGYSSSSGGGGNYSFGSTSGSKLMDSLRVKAHKAKILGTNMLEGMGSPTNDSTGGNFGSPAAADSSGWNNNNNNPLGTSRTTSSWNPNPFGNSSAYSWDANDSQKMYNTTTTNNNTNNGFGLSSMSMDASGFNNNTFTSTPSNNNLGWMSNNQDAFSNPFMTARTDQSFYTGFGTSSMDPFGASNTNAVTTNTNNTSTNVAWPTTSTNAWNSTPTTPTAAPNTLTAAPPVSPSPGASKSFRAVKADQQAKMQPQESYHMNNTTQATGGSHINQGVDTDILQSSPRDSAGILNKDDTSNDPHGFNRLKEIESIVHHPTHTTTEDLNNEVLNDAFTDLKIQITYDDEMRQIKPRRTPMPLDWKLEDDDHILPTYKPGSLKDKDWIHKIDPQSIGLENSYGVPLTEQSKEKHREKELFEADFHPDHMPPPKGSPESIPKKGVLVSPRSLKKWGTPKNMKLNLSGTPSGSTTNDANSKKVKFVGTMVREFYEDESALVDRRPSNPFAKTSLIVDPNTNTVSISALTNNTTTNANISTTTTTPATTTNTAWGTNMNGIGSSTSFIGNTPLDNTNMQSFNTQSNNTMNINLLQDSPMSNQWMNTSTTTAGFNTPQQSAVNVSQSAVSTPQTTFMTPTSPIVLQQGNTAFGLSPRMMSSIPMPTTPLSGVYTTPTGMFPNPSSSMISPITMAMIQSSRSNSVHSNSQASLNIPPNSMTSPPGILNMNTMTPLSANSSPRMNLPLVNPLNTMNNNFMPTMNPRMSPMSGSPRIQNLSTGYPQGIAAGGASPSTGYSLGIASTTPNLSTGYPSGGINNTNFTSSSSVNPSPRFNMNMNEINNTSSVPSMLPPISPQKVPSNSQLLPSTFSTINSINNNMSSMPFGMNTSPRISGSSRTTSVNNMNNTNNNNNTSTSMFPPTTMTSSMSGGIATSNNNNNNNNNNNIGYGFPNTNTSMNPFDTTTATANVNNNSNSSNTMLNSQMYCAPVVNSSRTNTTDPSSLEYKGGPSGGPAKRSEVIREDNHPSDMDPTYSEQDWNLICIRIKYLQNIAVTFDDILLKNDLFEAAELYVMSGHYHSNSNSSSSKNKRGSHPNQESESYENEEDDDENEGNNEGDSPENEDNNGGDEDENAKLSSILLFLHKYKKYLKHLDKGKMKHITNEIEELLIGFEDVLHIEIDSNNDIQDTITTLLQQYKDNIEILLQNTAQSFVPQFILSSDFAAYYEHHVKKKEKESLDMGTKSWLVKFVATFENDDIIGFHLYPRPSGRPTANLLMQKYFGPLCDSPNPREYIDTIHSNNDNVQTILQAFQMYEECYTTVKCRNIGNKFPESILALKPLKNNNGDVLFCLILWLDMTKESSQDDEQYLKYILQCLP